MKPNVKEFAKIISASLPIMDPVYEFGSLQVPEQVGFSNLRPLFPANQYIGCDMRQGPGVDKVLNLHDIDLPPESVGTILCFDTLEHVEFPRKALEEIYRVIKPNGIAIITSLMNFPIHEYPHDYWRFTPEAFKSILKPFQNSFVGFQGDPNFPHTVVGIGFKGDIPNLSEFEKKYTEWQTNEKKSIQDFVRQVTPPFLLPYLIQFVKHIRVSINQQ